MKLHFHLVSIQLRPVWVNRVRADHCTCHGSKTPVSGPDMLELSLSESVHKQSFYGVTPFGNNGGAHQ